MPRRRRLLPAAALLACLACAAAPPAQAGPWTPEPGHGYGKVWLKWLPGFGYMPGPEQAADGVSGPQVLGPYHELFVGTYLEVGVLPGMALVFHQEPVRTFLLGDPRDGSAGYHVGPGDPALGMRVQVVRAGRFAAALEGSARAPFASGEPVQAVYSAEEGNPRVGSLTVGTGVWEGYGGFSFGAGWDRVYFAAGAGLLGRGGGFDTVLLWSAEVGVPMPRRPGGSLRLRLGGHHPLGDGTAPYHQSPSGLGNGTRYVGATVEADYPVGGPGVLAVSVGGAAGPVARQIGGPAIQVGVAAGF